FITDQWFNTHADINMLTVSGNKLYAVGAADVDEGTFADYLSTPAILFEFNINNGKFEQADGAITYNYNGLTSYVGKDVDCNNGKLFTVTGDDGYLEIFDAVSMESKANSPIQDARSVKVHNNISYVLSGKGIEKYDMDGNFRGDLVEFPDNAINGGDILDGDYQGAQRILSVTDDCVVAPLGVYGVSAYDHHTGEELFHLQPASGYLDNIDYEIAVNSATVVDCSGEKYVLMATGEAGLSEAMVTSSGEIIYECVYDLDGASGVAESANMVTPFEMGDNLFIAVATGNDGLHLLRVADDEPDSGGDLPSASDVVLCDDKDLLFEIYNSSLNFSDLNGEQHNMTANGNPNISISEIGNGTLVWSGSLKLKAIAADAHLDICGNLQLEGDARLDGEVSGNVTLSAQNYNGALSIGGAVVWNGNCGAQLTIDGDFTLNNGNMNNASIEASGNVIVSAIANGSIISTGGDVTTNGQNNGVIKAYGKVLVEGDANGTIIITSLEGEVIVNGNNQNGYIHCPNGKVTVNGDNNSKIYVDAGNAGNVLIAGNKNGQVIEGQP
ncbi:MAG: hypothetical protein ACK5MI_10115, partial [Mangrovibacterium sp.]